MPKLCYNQIKAKLSAFTLLEVLISVAIASIFFTSVISMSSKHTDTNRHLLNKLEMIQVAENIIHEKRILSYSNDTITSSQGSMQLNNKVFYWQLEVGINQRSITVKNDPSYHYNSNNYELRWHN